MSGQCRHRAGKGRAANQASGTISLRLVQPLVDFALGSERKVAGFAKLLSACSVSSLSGMESMANTQHAGTGVRAMPLAATSQRAPAQPLTALYIHTWTPCQHCAAQPQGRQHYTGSGRPHTSGGFLCIPRLINACHLQMGDASGHWRRCLRVMMLHSSRLLQVPALSRPGT